MEVTLTTGSEQFHNEAKASGSFSGSCIKEILAHVDYNDFLGPKLANTDEETVNGTASSMPSPPSPM